MSGSPVGSEERTGPLSRAGRTCRERGCSTVLSVYNELDFCSLHQPMIVPRMRGVVLGD